MDDGGSCWRKNAKYKALSSASTVEMYAWGPEGTSSGVVGDPTSCRFLFKAQDLDHVLTVDFKSGFFWSNRSDSYLVFYDGDQSSHEMLRLSSKSSTPKMSYSTNSRFLSVRMIAGSRSSIDFHFKIVATLRIEEKVKMMTRDPDLAYYHRSMDDSGSCGEVVSVYRSDVEDVRAAPGSNLPSVCQLVFKSALAPVSLKMEFHETNLISIRSILRLYDGDNVKSPLLMTLNSTTDMPSEPILTSGVFLLVHYSRDSRSLDSLHFTVRQGTPYKTGQAFHAAAVLGGMSATLVVFLIITAGLCTYFPQRAAERRLMEQRRAQATEQAHRQNQEHVIRSYVIAPPPAYSDLDFPDPSSLAQLPTYSDIEANPQAYLVVMPLPYGFIPRPTSADNHCDSAQGIDHDASTSCKST
ncbi:uncharacterized protein LOC106160938 isoform X2 [Lingula anatina]|uniref:Uncharacterized protein LOC106160938 isoform X2 n=1 Tax=Lingula anatina TaxID=7574 RepID=A0A1S3I754_LINAN|nr:uncharacterized protein LOC106160938 isoform X2 [Lingula anatina]|eukprot:XP_013393199.1 uncharacterized protein LOC106160938 isoform X2 [Lingula anatina]